MSETITEPNPGYTASPCAATSDNAFVSTTETCNESGFIIQKYEKIHSICSVNSKLSLSYGASKKRERNGTADYYLDGSDVNIVSNEGKGIGSFIMASLEYEKYITASVHPSISVGDSSVKIFDLYGHRCPTAPKGYCYS